MVDFADVVATDATLTSEAVFALPAALPQLLQAPPQPLADALGVSWASWLRASGMVVHPQSSLNMSCFSVGLSGERETVFQAVLMSCRAQLWAMRVAIFMRLFSQGMLGSKASAEAGALGR